MVVLILCSSSAPENDDSDDDSDDDDEFFSPNVKNLVLVLVAVVDLKTEVKEALWANLVNFPRRSLLLAEIVRFVRGL